MDFTYSLISSKYMGLYFNENYRKWSPLFPSENASKMPLMKYEYILWSLDSTQNLL